MVPPGRDDPAVGGDPLEPAERQHRRHRSNRDGHHSEHDWGDEVAGGGVPGPQGDRGDGQDGELAGGEPGEELVGPLDVGRYPYPGLVVTWIVGVAVAGGHSPTPAARALAPL